MKSIVVVFLLAGFHFCTAQESSRIPVKAIKWSPAHLAFHFPTIQLSYEQPIFRTLSLNTDIGLVFNDKNSETEQYSRKRGVRLALEPRFYLPSTAPHAPFYLGLDLYAHLIRFNQSETIGYGCTDGCDYYQSVTYTTRYNQWRTGVKVGALLYLPIQKTRPLFMDVSVGVAYRSSHRDESARPSPPDSQRILPPDPDRVNPLILNTWDYIRTSNVVVPTLSVRIGYRFGHQ